MRGTVLKLKSHNFEYSFSEDDSGGECNKDKLLQDDQSIPKHMVTPSCVESPSQDLNKNVLMSTLELRRTSVASEADSYLASNTTAQFQRTVFDWNDESMWKAMSRHPLFSKYMELQSQLNSLFEEIRLDCKKAACEKAFSSLMKESKESPIQATPVTLQAKVAVETIPKKRGRPLKKKPGRPRKEDSTTSSTELSNGTAVTPNKNMRKCREELFLARKPSWICQNCARRFSSSGWLDRHKSVCSFSKLASESPSGNRVDEDAVRDTSEVMEDDSQSSEHLIDRKYSVSKSSDTSISLSPSRSSRFKLNGTSHSSLPTSTFQTNPSPISPLKPKMENHNGTEEDEVLRKPMCNEEHADVESSATSCGKCKLQFSAQIYLKGHLEEYPECKVYASPHGSDGDSGEYSSDSSVSACKHCGKTFKKEKFLKRHQSMCHVKSKKKLWQCSNCFKAFRRQSHQEQHQRKCISKGKHTAKEAQRCENCSLLFPTQKKLLKHQAICCPDSNNHMVKLLKCLKCSMVFPTYKKQIKHRAKCCPDSDTDAMVCRYCSKVLIMKDRMDAHRRKCQKLVRTPSS